MQVRVKLMASLRSRVPAAQAGRAAPEVAAGTSIQGVLEVLGIPPGHVHLVMVNGEMEPDRTRQVVDGDELTVFPPIAGG